MHDIAFADSVRPAQSAILKLPMLDYSIGHEVLLLGQRNALLLSGFESLPELKKRKAIIQAALICCQTWRQNKNPHRWLGIWGRRIRGFDVDSEAANFFRYRVAGSSFPPQPDEESDRMANGKDAEGREIGSPFLARLYNFVCTLPNCGEPFDFPLGFASFLYFAHLEKEGCLKVENSKENQIKCEMVEHRAAIAKEAISQGSSQ